MADYIWARDGFILGISRTAGTDANEVEALPSREIQRLLDRGYISLKSAAPDLSSYATDAELAAAVGSAGGDKYAAWNYGTNKWFPFSPEFRYAGTNQNAQFFTDSVLYATPMLAPLDVTISHIGFYMASVSGISTGGTFSLGVFRDRGDNAGPGAVLGRATYTEGVNFTGGNKEIATSGGNKVIEAGERLWTVWQKVFAAGTANYAALMTSVAMAEAMNGLMISNETVLDAVMHNSRYIVSGAAAISDDLSAITSWGAPTQTYHPPITAYKVV